MKKMLYPLGAVALLALTGCSGGAAPASGAAEGPKVYEFAGSYGDSTSGELTIRIPGTLLEAAGSDADGLLITEVKATPRELDGAKMCAVDLAVAYAGDAPDVLTKPKMTEAEWEIDQQQRFENELMNAFGIGSEDELLALTDEELVEYGLYREDVLSYIEELNGYLAEDAYSPTPSWSLLQAAQPVAELDEADPASGLYHSDDYATLTLVQPCAKSVSDYDSSSEFWFPAVNDEGEIDQFATLNLLVMKSGTMAINEGEIADYVRDSEGHWLAS